MTTTSRGRINWRVRRNGTPEPPAVRDVHGHATGRPAPMLTVAPGRYPGEPERPADLVLRCRTRGRAWVDITGRMHGDTRWRCRGCLYDSDIARPLAYTRDEANEHAAACWAIDLAAPPANVTWAKPRYRRRFSGRGAS